MGRLDTSKAGELRLLAEMMRRRARDMTMSNYVDQMERAACELDAEAMFLERNWPPDPGHRLNIIV